MGIEIAALDAAIWRRAANELTAARLPDGRLACRILADVDALTGKSGAVEVRDVLRRSEEILEQRDITRRLSSIPVIEQRTPAWYAARHEMITASDVAQCLGHGKFSNSTPRAFFEKKVPDLALPEPRVPDGVAVDVHALPDPPVIPPLKWGTMFEDAAINVYEKRTDVHVTPFGLLRHPDPAVPLGASPDGITDTGVMLEIKCPFMRVIDGQVPLQYYYQIQAQLEVCGLRCCDFLECSFSVYEDEDAFYSDRLLVHDDADDLDPERSYCGLNGREKGVVAEYVEVAEDGVSAKHAYAYLEDLCPSRTRVEEWKADRIADVSERRRFGRFHFWRLERYSVVRVEKDDRFVREMVDEVKGVWEKVTEFRRDPEAFQRYLLSTATKSSGAGGKRGGGALPKQQPTKKDAGEREDDAGGCCSAYAFIDRPDDESE